MVQGQQVALQVAVVVVVVETWVVVLVIVMMIIIPCMNEWSSSSELMASY